MHAVLVRPTLIQPVLCTFFFNWPNPNPTWFMHIFFQLAWPWSNLIYALFSQSAQPQSNLIYALFFQSAWPQSNPIYVHFFPSAQAQSNPIYAHFFNWPTPIQPNLSAFFWSGWVGPTPTQPDLCPSFWSGLVQYYPSVRFYPKNSWIPPPNPKGRPRLLY